MNILFLDRIASLEMAFSWWPDWIKWPVSDLMEFSDQMELSDLMELSQTYIRIIVGLLLDYCRNIIRIL